MFRPIMELTPAQAERFERLVTRGEAGVCWQWTGRCSGSGYGVLYLGSTRFRAHRVAFRLANGIDPGAAEVMHSCDNRRCCNPAHLSLGTHDDNMRDMVSKRRQCRGETLAAPKRGSRNPQAKLTVSAVVAIREERARGDAVHVVAARHGISAANVVRISHGEGWPEAGGPIIPKLTAAQAQLLGAAARKERRRASSVG